MTVSCGDFGGCLQVTHVALDLIVHAVREDGGYVVAINIVDTHNCDEER